MQEVVISAMERRASTPIFLFGGGKAARYHRFSWPGQARPPGHLQGKAFSRSRAPSRNLGRQKFQLETKTFGGNKNNLGETKTIWGKTGRRKRVIT